MPSDESDSDALRSGCSSKTTDAPEDAQPEPSTDTSPDADAPNHAPPRWQRRPRRRIASILFLAFGGLVAAYLGTQGPQEQHVRVVLGDAAPDVTAVDLRYVAKDGDVARSAHFTYPKGAAPRIVAHEPQLPNGDYRIDIDIDLDTANPAITDGETWTRVGEADATGWLGRSPKTPGHDGDHPRARDGRRAVQRQVTLGGGSTQIDVSTAAR